MSERVPEGWKKDTLGNLCSSIRGVSYKPKDLRNEKSTQTVTLLRSNNIQEGGIDFSNVQYVGINKVKQKQIMTDEDIAVCMSNGSKRLVGKSASLQNHVISETFTVGAFCSIIRATEKSSHQFVRHLLKSDDYKQQVEFSLAGSAINNLKDGDVENYTFLLPPLPEQKKIASILTSVDEVIENTQKQIDKFQDLKKATMNELLTKGIGHTEFKDSELGRIPKSWDVKSVGELFEVRGRIGWKGYTVNDLRKDGPLVLGGTQIDKNHKIDLSRPVYLSEEKYLESPEIMIEDKDLILVKTGNTIGKLAQIDGNLGKATINPNTVILRSKSEIQDFVYQILTSKKYQEKFWEFVAVGAQPSLNQHNIKSIMIPLPQQFERDKINKVLFAMDRIIEEKNQKMSQTQSLKKSLMQDLLTGKVRVQVN